MGPTNSNKRNGDELAPAAYAELHALAQRFMGGERRDHTLQPTELVHEAWMRIARARSLDEGDRVRFLGLAATTMRHILVDHARARLADRRAADREVPLLEDPAGGEERLEAKAAGIESIDRALALLEERDPALGRVVELRFFGGLTVEETAQALGISPRSVKRVGRLARAWLHSKLMEEKRGA
jgi:RNA polymerase sigma factor (TIGR02999 family)